MDHEAAEQPIAVPGLQAVLHRRQWQRYLLSFAVIGIMVFAPWPADLDIARLLGTGGAMLFGYLYCARIKCPRCHQPIMRDHGGFGFHPRRDCPTCFWPSPLTPDQHRRLVVDLEHGSRRARRRKDRD